MATALSVTMPQRTLPKPEDIGHLLWIRGQNEQYGTTAHTAFGLYRLVRAALNPLQAAGQETAGMFTEKVATVLSHRLRLHATQIFVCKVGRAAIDLYAGRLALSDEEMRLARECDAVAPAASAAPVRLILVGQVNAYQRDPVQITKTSDLHPGMAWARPRPLIQ